MNEVLFFKIYSLAGQCVWLDRVAIFFAVYSGYILGGIVVALYLYNRKKNKSMFFEAVIGAVLARFGITQLIRFLYHHPRPFEAISSVKNLIPESGSSFPSGHASFFFALSTIVWLYNRKLGWVFYGVSIIMGIARVFVGVHWSADILSGIFVGVLVALATHYFHKKFFSKNT